jgi:alkylation response protein AidB-like acyl-CoA dehydrogenase
VIVDLNPTEDQRLIVDTVETLLSRALPVERLRQPASFGGGSERGVWSDLVELGLFGFGLAESSGGIGYGLPEEVLAARSFGRHCVSANLIATIIGVHVAAADRHGTMRDALRTGTARAAFANPLDNGNEMHLIDADGCDWFVILGNPLRLVPRSAMRDRQSVRAIDETVSFERARLGGGVHIAADLGRRESLLLAAYLVGNAQATLAMATAYACTREQFGQPIGAFQAIKHSCADMAVRSSAAEAQIFYAALLGTGSDGVQAMEIASARLLAREAAVLNAKANIQIHGAMGFTAECDAHLYLKRALLFASLGSSSRMEEKQILAGGGPRRS